MKILDLQESFIQSLQNPGQGSESLINPILNLSRGQCLEIYRKGYSARLTEALGSTFEACWWVLGDDSFFKVARDYIASHPSQAYDLSDYGERFPEFLQAHPESLDIPFIPDLSRFEWHFKETFHSPSCELDSAPGALSGDEFLFLKPSVKILSAPFDVYEIWKRRTQKIEDLSGVPWDQASNYLLARSQGQTYVYALSPKEFDFLNAIRSAPDQNHNIGEILETLSQKHSDLDPQFISDFFEAYSPYLSWSPCPRFDLASP